jgi:site-specific DNA-methyltransferase (adenine-specific)
MEIKPYYDDGNGIVIYNQDCRLVLPSLPKVDLVLTDPPYGAGYASNPILRKNRASKPHQRQNWDGELFPGIDKILGAGVDAVIWGGIYYPLPCSRCWFIWYKPDALPSMADCELAWVSRDGNAQLFAYTIAAGNQGRVGHPTQKPLPLMKWCVAQFPAAQTIIDPFMGSGTTLVAAKQLGRRAIGIEICESYCKIAVDRLRQSVLDFEPVRQATDEQMELLESSPEHPEGMDNGLTGLSEKDSGEYPIETS